MTNINVEHPEYKTRKAMWRKYRDLYAGGEQCGRMPQIILRSVRKNQAMSIASGSISCFTKTMLARLSTGMPRLCFVANHSCLLRDEPIRSKFFSDFAENCDLKGRP